MFVEVTWGNGADWRRGCLSNWNINRSTKWVGNSYLVETKIVEKNCQEILPRIITKIVIIIQEIFYLQDRSNLRKTIPRQRIKSIQNVYQKTQRINSIHALFTILLFSERKWEKKRCIRNKKDLMECEKEKWDVPQGFFNSISFLYSLTQTSPPSPGTKQSCQGCLYW